MTAMRKETGITPAGEPAEVKEGGARSNGRESFERDITRPSWDDDMAQMPLNSLLYRVLFGGAPGAEKGGVRWIRP